MDEDVYAFLCKRRDAVLYVARVQARYHRYRQRFFDLTDKLIKALTLALGVTVLGSELKRFSFVAWSLSTLSLVSLVFTISDRKQMHKELAESATSLAADVLAVPSEELTPVSVARWESEFARLSGKCPPPLKTLTLICEREQSIVDGYPDHVKEPSRFAKYFRHIY